LAAQIRAIREARGLDTKACAEQLGKKLAWIYRLEDPNAAVPTVPSLLDVARTFDVDLQVQFRPFSKRLDELITLSDKSFDVPSFGEEVAQGAFAEQTATTGYYGQHIIAQSSPPTNLFAGRGEHQASSGLWLVPKQPRPDSVTVSGSDDQGIAIEVTIASRGIAAA
jgi:transcriptional regulator with XRE-family HTH domain